MSVGDKLPIYRVKDQLIAILSKENRIVLDAPTGTGKSTQMPQILLEAQILSLEEKILILQPRRIAAKLLAHRVATELGVTIGGLVGYQIRHENVTSTKTRVLFITEGVLLRYLQEDPLLNGVGAVVFDEFHERHLYTDLSLPLIAQLQSLRPELKMIVMSATLESKVLENYLKCPVLQLEERLHPVEVAYSFSRNLGTGGREQPIWEKAAEALAQNSVPLLPDGRQGNVLIFMPGSHTIYKTLEAIGSIPFLRGYKRFPLYSELPVAQQEEALASGGEPKVIVATNIAETSVTIDGITLVIDGGQAKIPYYDSTRGINSLEVAPISQASAKQRAGRAGRIAPGKVVRLWSQKEQDQRPINQEAEILRLDLAEVVLLLLSLGIELKKFPWYEAPPAESVEGALHLLDQLGALDKGTLTELGWRIVALPTHPRYGRMLLHALDEGCGYEGAYLVSVIEANLRPGRREDKLGNNLLSDHFYWFTDEKTLQKELRVQQIKDLQKSQQQFQRLLSDSDEMRGTSFSKELSPQVHGILQKAILLGFPDQLAVAEGGGRYRLKGKRKATVASSSAVILNRCIVSSLVKELQPKAGMKNGGKAIPGRELELHNNTVIQEEWLKDFFPEACTVQLETVYNAQLKRVITWSRHYYHDLLLSEKEAEEVDQEGSGSAWNKVIADKRIELPLMDHRIEQWVQRMSFASTVDSTLPKFTSAMQEAAVNHLCQGVVTLQQLQAKDPLPFFKDAISREQRKLLDMNFPEEITLPNGRKYKVQYSSDRAPLIRCRIQELFGITKLERLAGGKVGIIIEILAPNQRPVQITQDLESFWKESYPKIKSELQRRYPKHEWR